MLGGFVAGLAHTAGGFASAGVPSCWRRVLAGVLLAGDVPIGRGNAVGRQPKNRLEGNMPIKTAVVAEDELVEVGVDVLAAKAVIGPEAPTLQEGEHPMNPLEGNVRRHVADDAGIVPIFGDTRIRGVPVGDQRRAWRDVGLDEGMDVRRVVAGNGGEPDAPRQGVEVLPPESLGFLRFPGGPVDHFDSTDDDDLAGLQRDVGIGGGGAERHLGLVHLDHALQRIAVRIDHRAPQLLRQQPGGLVGAEAQLPHQLLRRHAVGVGRHQVGGPEPRRQRQFGPVHDRPCRRRSLPSAGDTLIGIGTALQQAGTRPTAFRAREPVRPAPLGQEERTTRFVRKTTLEFEERGVFPCHAAGLCGGNQPHARGTWDNGISLDENCTNTPLRSFISSSIHGWNGTINQI